MSSQDANIQTSAKILELFESCKTLHRISYPDPKLDFDRLNLTQRLKRQQQSTESGGYADLYKGSLNSGDKVAVKVMRFVSYNPRVEEGYKIIIMCFFREMTVWYDLDHINIAPLLGFTLGNGGIGLVSRWYTNGNVVNYLEMNPKASKPDLVLDVAEGIKFLHTRPNPLIHADLKGVNILVAESGIACISDFRISEMINDIHHRTGLAMSSGVADTPRWMAPEQYNEGPLTPASDVYSFAWVIIEIYCPPKVPYHYIANDMQVIRTKLEGKLPDRTHYPELHDQDVLWDIVSACFSHDPQRRPSITSITEELYKTFALSPRAALSTSPRPRSTKHVATSKSDKPHTTTSQLTPDHTPQVPVPPEPSQDQVVRSPQEAETVLYGELKTQWADWSRRQSQQGAWCDEHTIMANAEALYEWDGTIPQHRTPGLPLTKEKFVQICNIIDEFWCQAHHQGKCEYVPRQFVNIGQPLDERVRRLIRAYPNPPPPPPPVIQPPAPEPVPSFFARLCCCCCCCCRVEELSNAPIPPEDPNAPSSQVPPAPFDGEPSDFVQNNSRVLTHAKCEGFNTGSIVKCFITLIPAAQWRFTRLKFAAKLQSGHIVGLFPQRVAGGSTAAMRGQRAAATITGDGVDSRKVTWIVEENAAVSSGLPSRLELSILLPTPSPPPRLTCSYQVRLRHDTQSDAEERFGHTWDFNFTLDPQSRSYG